MLYNNVIKFDAQCFSVTLYQNNTHHIKCIFMSSDPSGEYICIQVTDK